MDITSVCNKQSKMGLAGLQNLGNTCFMASILQCLSNTEPLVKFFLFEVFSYNINYTSVYGSKGKLAIAYADLVCDLYIGDANYVAPWDIKRIISQKASQFLGFQQHDSMEFLSIFLETLHEDVNSISQKPYIEVKEQVNKSEHELSQLYWNNFKKRENSVFIDLFYGQLKSKLQCKKCGKKSLNFDPFSILSLPIPNQNNF